MNRLDSVRGSTSRSLVLRLQENRAPAWRDLVHLYSPLILYWARRAGLPDNECADVVQEVFRSVVANIRTFKKTSSRDTFRGWLRTITRNKVNDFFRRQGAVVDAIGGTEARIRMLQNADVDDELVGDPEEMAADHALFTRAIELIREDFQPHTWQAFWRVVVEGKSATEVASELNTRPGSVRVAKSRVLKRLREQLGETST
jgi:RNA polymerase sigma-70 factor (ECF subfamily)